MNSVPNLLDRARRICSATKLLEELDFLKTVFHKNGYKSPEDMVARLIDRERTNQDKGNGPDRCGIYLRLPWKGNLSNAVTYSQVVGF